MPKKPPASPPLDNDADETAEKKPASRVKGKKRRGRIDSNSAEPSDAGAVPAGARAGRGVGPDAVDDRAAGEIQDTRAFIDKVHRWFRQSSEASKKWRENYIENMRFLSSDAWSEADKAALEREGRPELNINKILAPVMTISGIQRQSRQEIKLLPFEPDDSESTELMQVLLKFHRDKTKLGREDSRVFLDKIAAGLGFWKLWYDFSRRPQGDIRCSRRNPLNIFWDPNWPECDWEDTEYVIDATWYSLEAAIAEWPAFEEKIRSRFGEWLPATGAAGVGSRGELAGDAMSYRRDFWDAQTQRVRVLEVMYRELVEVDVAVFKDGEVVSDPEQVEAIKQVMADMGEAEVGDAVAITRRPVRFTRVAHVLDDILLDDDDSPFPFTDLNIVPSLGYYFWKYPFGMVDLAKDPQREKNKRRAAITEIASRAAHSGFFNKRGTGAKREDLIEHATGAGVVVEYETDKPEKIHPDEIPQVLVMLENKSDQEINEVLNVNQELLGQTTQVTVSGRAIEARQRGGLLTQGVFFDSFAEELETVARLMIAMIKQKVTIDEAFRILGSLATKKQDNQQQDVPLQGAGISEVETVLSRAFSTEYDVVISVKPEDPTHAYAMWQTLLEAAKVIPIPPDIIVAAGVKAGAFDRTEGERIRAALLAQETGTPRPDAPQPPAPQAAPGAVSAGAPPSPPPQAAAAFAQRLPASAPTQGLDVSNIPT